MSQRPSLTRGLPLCEPEALPDPGPAPLPARRELSREPHPASSRQDEALVQLLLQRWQDPESGLDLAEASSYEVLLSFPSPEQPNQVAIGEVLPSPSPPPTASAQGQGAVGPKGHLRHSLGHAPHPLAPNTALSAVGPAGDIRFSCRQSEENLTGEQGGPDVLPPYAAYAPPGTPQVGLQYPLPLPGPAAPLPPQLLPS